jgi:glycosyltransferase involved in cell wall biosynthesis
MDHPFQLAPRIVARLCGIRVLTSIHDAVRHPGEESRLLDLIAQVSLRASDGVMTYSAAVARKLRVVTAIGRVQIFQTVIGAFGAPQQRGGARSAPNAPFTVGFFGRIEAYKGLARLAGAIVELRERGVDVRLSIHGRGQLSASEQLLLEQADAKVNNSWVSDTEIQAVIESFDILALPYDDASQSGVIGYALSSGTPTVATPVEGLREQVSDSGGGILARGMTTHDFAAALEELIVDPKLYRTLSEHAVESARSTYSWDRVSADILSAARLLAKAPKA